MTFWHIWQFELLWSANRLTVSASGVLFATSDWHGGRCQCVLNFCTFLLFFCTVKQGLLRSESRLAEKQNLQMWNFSFSLKEDQVLIWNWINCLCLKNMVHNYPVFPVVLVTDPWRLRSDWCLIVPHYVPSSSFSVARKCRRTRQLFLMYLLGQILAFWADLQSLVEVCVLIINTLHTVGSAQALSRCPVKSSGLWCITNFKKIFSHVY